MLNFAEAEFSIATRMKDGSTKKEHLVAAWKQTGVKPEELDFPPPRETIAYLWEYFLELHVARQTGLGISALSYTEVDAWQRLTKRSLDPWELSAIMKLDAVFLSIARKSTTEGQ